MLMTQGHNTIQTPVDQLPCHHLPRFEHPSSNEQRMNYGSQHLIT
jgi:hypothetical protein